MNKTLILSPLCKKGNKLKGLKPSPKISQPGYNRTQICAPHRAQSGRLPSSPSRGGWPGPRLPLQTWVVQEGIRGQTH